MNFQSSDTRMASKLGTILLELARREGDLAARADQLLAVIGRVS